jgi:hypothetical protein
MSNGEVEEITAADVAPPPTGLGVTVTQGLPDVKMIVNEGSVVSPSGEDRSYEGGEEITVSGPDAISLAAQGVATAVGPADAPAEAAVEEAPVEPPVEEAPPA